MALQPPFVPYVDEFDVLDLDELAGQDLITSIQLENAPLRYWVHPNWRGTSVHGVATDVTGPPMQISFGDERLEVRVSSQQLSAIDKGHALYSYTLQPTSTFEYGHEDSLRRYVLIGKRYFPGGGLTVAVVQQANQLLFDDSTLGGVDAHVTVVPWQAMAAGDRLRVTWRGFRSTGTSAGDHISVVDIGESDVGYPVSATIPLSSIRLIRAGHGLLSYEVEYAHTHEVTAGPVQRFDILPAASERLPPLAVEGLVGNVLDPGAFDAGMTLDIQTFVGLEEGDMLVFFVEDVLSGSTLPLASVRLDSTSVDSERLQCRIMPDWVRAYMDRDIRLTYHVARPRRDWASEPLTLSVRATMYLPMPIVQGASGAGQAHGEFKAEDTNTGIKIWVPGLAVYPPQAAVEMHWQGFGAAGSTVVRTATGDTPMAFLIAPGFVAPNMGKDVRVFYRVTRAGDPPRDSQVFTLKVLAVPEYRYPTLECLHATNGVMSLATVPQSGSMQTVAPWILMAVGQRMLLTATGTLNGGTATSITLLDNELVNSGHLNAGVRKELNRTWLTTLQIGTTIMFTMRVSADDGESYVTFPRVYVQLQR